MSASWRVIPILILGVVGNPADAAGGLVDANVRFEPSEAPGCAVAVPLLGCAFSWGHGERSEVGDDKVRVEKRVESVDVEAKPSSSGPHQEISLRLSGLELRHSLTPTANRTWRDANGSLPGPAREFVTLDSRPAANRPGSWGFFFSGRVSLPPFLTPGVPQQYGVGFCWNLNDCPVGWEDNSLFEMDEETVRLFPGEVWLRRWSTDAFAAAILREPFSCTQAWKEPICRATQGFRPVAQTIEEIQRGWTPEATVEIRVRGSTIRIGDLETALHDSAGPHDSAISDSAAIAMRELRAGAERTARSSPEGDPSRAAQRDTAVPADSVWLPEPGRPAASASTPPSAFPLAILGGVFFVALLLYHRIHRRSVLDQKTRKAILDFIVAEPGNRVGTIAATMGLDYKTIRHHVGLLERWDLVWGTSPREGHRRYFATGSVTREEARAINALCRDSVRRVYGFLQRNGPANLSTIARAAGFSVAATSRCVSRLRGVGLVETQKEGRNCLVSPIRLQPPRLERPDRSRSVKVD